MGHYLCCCKAGSEDILVSLGWLSSFHLGHWVSLSFSVCMGLRSFTEFCRSLGLWFHAPFEASTCWAGLLLANAAF